MFIGYYNYTVIATYASLACGIAGVAFAFGGNVFASILFLLSAGVLDMFDGKIARTKKDRSANEKLFGIQIDSLCDLISFGVLPAAICLGAGMTAWYYVILYIAYVTAAQIRLGYFNIDEMNRQKQTEESRKYYRGLPVTSAAGVFPLVYTFSSLLGTNVRNISFAVLMLFCTVMFILNVNVPKPVKKAPYILIGAGVVMLACMIIFKVTKLIV